MLHVESLVRTHAKPHYSIHDITESLASHLLAKFPAALAAIVEFAPDIRTNFKNEELRVATCLFTKPSPRAGRPSNERNNSMYEIHTDWELPTSPRPGFVTSLYLTTGERSESPVHVPISKSRTPRFGSGLSHVHPTFGIHEQVATFAKQLQVDTLEGAALLLAQLSFHLADKQSPCKRLKFVRVIMRDAMPLQDAVRTLAASKIERLRRRFINDNFSSCKIELERQEYEQSQLRLLSNEHQSGRHRAFLALGSNLGNRLEMIESAMRKMDDRGLTVLRTSALYETQPMYLENQELFINGACEVCSINASYH